MLSDMTGARDQVKTVPSTSGTTGADGGSAAIGDVNGMIDFSMNHPGSALGSTQCRCKANLSLRSSTFEVTDQCSKWDPNLSSTEDR